MTSNFRGQTFGKAGQLTSVPRSERFHAQQGEGAMEQDYEPMPGRNVAAGPVAAAAPAGEPAAQVECPFCAELISARARKCRHCGETVDVAMRKAEEALRATERSGHVYMNAGGGAVAGGMQQLRPFNHALHIILSIITVGWWLPVYLLLYLFRNKSIYF